MDKQITDLKIKLKYVMEKKTEKTLNFFNETCDIFINYYDALNKIKMYKITLKFQKMKI